MKAMKSSRWVLVVVSLGILVLAAGCSDDDPVQVTGTTDPEPNTPQELLVYFQTSYEARDVDNYLALLDPDFQFILREDTALRYPDLGPALDFDEEEQIHHRLFSGSMVIDPGGDPQPGVREVIFNHFQALDYWAPTDDEANFPNAFYAPFELDLIIDCGQEFATYKATGQAKIYVREYSRMNGSEEVIFYKLAGMVDLTQADKGIERTPWGLIKALYR